VQKKTLQQMRQIDAVITKILTRTKKYGSLFNNNAEFVSVKICSMNLMNTVCYIHTISESRPPQGNKTCSATELDYVEFQNN
jgi:hypothetical protein